MMPQQTERSALVLSGGGARGAYQAGVLKALARALPGPLPFEVVTGVSVGAINAAVMAEGAEDFRAAADKLERLWRSLHCSSVFETAPGKLFGRMFKMGFAWTGLETPKSLLDVEPLARLLRTEIDYEKIEANILRGLPHSFAVTASSYATGESVTFFQTAEGGSDWCRARRRGKARHVCAEQILASAALPGLFEARRIEGAWYGDGALRQMAPLSPAIHLGAQKLFLIAARDGTPDAEESPISDPDEYPTLGVLGGQMLDIIFNDNLDADLERLHRINYTLSSMIPERRERTNLRALETHMVRPSQDLRMIAGQHMAEVPRSVRTMLGAIGGMKAPYVLPSYLTFEPGYVGALIDLGEADAEASMPQLLAFLEGEPERRSYG
ncbi:patatin-like phospholipase family protein [Parvularcula maris]|uniref:Patatin-like phospholipase family protein n=1 Tax=Parvularcula maris TaxID=2965077 RepID=A0A9X2RIA5_9PROT|nr:patatin-like phospholipase family protein [Parvularcula maris]MCQ8185835.1 patatin-like phospholipase family protein [Parvularcula maris]